ncbi:MAG: recombination protein NinG [Saprospiraceae bacterium]
MKKYKKCKGINKAFGFESCNEEVIAQSRKYGLCTSCFAKWLYSTEKGKELIRGSILKVQKPRIELEKAKKGGLIDYKKKLQNKINQIVRFIDRSEPCLAKGIYSKQVHAGHIYSRGSNPTICFNLHNIHRQSAQSNHFQNEDGLLREGLMQEYGVDYFNFVSELRRTESLRYSNDEYKAFYRKSCKLFNSLKKSLKTFEKVKERIEERNRINLEMNIYNKKYCLYNH